MILKERLFVRQRQIILVFGNQILGEVGVRK
jgi:hypothetical protein